jgi:hypothetical protein
VANSSLSRLIAFRVGACRRSWFVRDEYAVIHQERPQELNSQLLTVYCHQGIIMS